MFYLFIFLVFEGMQCFKNSSKLVQETMMNKYLNFKLRWNQSIVRFEPVAKKKKKPP